MRLEGIVSQCCIIGIFSVIRCVSGPAQHNVPSLGVKQRDGIWEWQELMYIGYVYCSLCEFHSVCKSQVLILC